MSDSYSATFIRVMNGSTVYMNVEVAPSQFEERRIRLKGIQTENIQKQYHTSFGGASGVLSSYQVLEWFSMHAGNFTLEVEQIDICGRFLAILIHDSTLDNLNEYLVSLYHRNDDWLDEKQSELKEDWFEGEVVRIPGGDILPIFRIWGKGIFIGFNSSQFRMR